MTPLTQQNDLPDITAGDDVAFDVTLTDKDSGNAIDLTGATLSVTVKDNPGQTDDDAAITKDITAHTDAVAGQTRFVFTSAETTPMLGNKFYDVQLLRADGTRQTFLVGRVRFVHQITSR